MDPGGRHNPQRAGYAGAACTQANQHNGWALSFWKRSTGFARHSMSVN